VADVKPVKLWHDDIRLPPDDSWVWARTNEQAKAILIGTIGFPSECSLDHDLGLHECDPHEEDADLRMGQAADTGYDLVKWMVEADCVPPKVTIHSWNTQGAKNMADYIVNAFRHKAITNKPVVIVQPFDLSIRGA
jgi:hypothetical protein